jgi:hypothetical protein
VTALNSAARYFSRFSLTAILVFPLFIVAPAPVEAQIYYSIYGGYRQTPPTPYRDDRGSGNPFVDFFGSLFGSRPRGGDDDDDEKKKSSAFANHCVRTCDGKFFPVSRGGRKDLSLDKICSAMCPAAQTKVFSGMGIENSSATDGQKYSAIPNAFVYRTKIVDNCTCNGRDPFGVARVDLENDPTLQGGDLVVQSDGFSVYRGTGDYVPIEKSGINPALVKQLIATKILPDNPHATFAKTLPVEQPIVPVTADTHPNTTPEIPAPNANAPAVTPPAHTN